MNFGKKIFIMSFVMNVLSIYIIGYCIISNNYKTNIEAQIEKSIFQINTIYHNFILYQNEKGIAILANQYRQDNIQMEVNSEEKLVYSNITEDVSNIREKMQSTDDSNVQVYIEDDTLYMQFRKDTIEILMISNLSKINKNRIEQIEFFIKLTVLFSVIIAFILSILVGVLTNKIKKLSQMATQIEEGNYEIAIAKTGNDEIGNLAKAFNNMNTAIKGNIAQLSKIAEDRKDFIHNLTHEIRTPLTSIIGYSSLIKNKKVKEEEKIQEYCTRIYQEGMYIKEITDKLMEIILLESQDQEVQKMNISDAVEQIIDDLEQQFKNVIIKKNITSGIEKKVDFILLKALLNNLIKNAIKAYDRQPVIIQVILEKEMLQIIDFGKGIPANQIDKILEPFYTQSKDRNREFSGMGLGLPLCMKICEAFGWKLGMESQVGKGTKVFIKIGDNYEKEKHTN